jgi:hypothetical protein
MTHMTSQDLLDQFFADDDGFYVRVVVLAVVCVFIWRAIFLLAQTPPPQLPRHEPPAASADAEPRGSWWRSKTDRLRAAVDRQRAETDLLLSQTQSVEATKGLAQARADLSSVIAELAPKPKQERTAAAAALTLHEITNILELVDLSAEDRAHLQALFIAVIEDKRS